MGLRRVCLLILGFTVSIGICCVWVVLQLDAIPVVNGYAEVTALPMPVQGTTLVAEEILSYEGEYIEDTEFGEFVYATGLILRNTGDQGVICSKVKLTGASDCLEFSATYIPAGEAVLVLEKNRKKTEDMQFYSCSGTAEYDNHGWEEHRGIAIQYLDNDGIKVTNTTNKSISGIQLYYKTIYPQNLFYVGGITHCYRINNLSVGESITVYPAYFSGVHSKIVCVRTILD